jgi:hypothetical protein
MNGLGRRRKPGPSSTALAVQLARLAKQLPSSKCDLKSMVEFFKSKMDEGDDTDNQGGVDQGDDLDLT